MVRSLRKPALLPMLIALTLFVGALFGIHTFVDSNLGREIADLSVVVMFFGGLLLLAGRM